MQVLVMKRLRGLWGAGKHRSPGAPGTPGKAGHVGWGCFAPYGANTGRTHSSPSSVLLLLLLLLLLLCVCPQAAMPVCVFAQPPPPEASSSASASSPVSTHLELRGGTDADLAPPAGYLREVLVPLLGRLYGGLMGGLAVETVRGKGKGRRGVVGGEGVNFEPIP